MATDDPTTVLTQLARVGQAMASPHRLHLVNLLFQGEQTVAALATELGQSEASTSAHLKVLRQAHLVEATRDGRQVWCRLADPAVARLWVAIREAGEATLPEVRAAQRELDGGDDDAAVAGALDGRGLLRRLKRGDTVVLDLRSAREYAAGHIPGARSVPFPSLRRARDTLPTRTPIVAYCRGAYCDVATRATAQLRRAGWDATRLHAGMGEWLAAGLPIERGQS